MLAPPQSGVGPVDEAVQIIAESSLTRADDDQVVEDSKLELLTGRTFSILTLEHYSALPMRLNVKV